MGCHVLTDASSRLKSEQGRGGDSLEIDQYAAIYYL